MDRILIEAKPDGRRTELLWDEADRKVHLVGSQDVDSLLDRNQALRNEAPGRLTRSKGDLHYVCTLSAEQVAFLKTAGIWDDEDALKKWLNDIDNRNWRVDNKQL